MAILRERKGKKPDTVYPVLASRSPTVIGRDESADVTLDDDRSSRRHAGIVRRYGSWIIQDLKSSNGTLVGGEKIDKKRLEDGATIQIGNTLLEFQPHELAPPPEGELEGARLLETLREEGGCFVFRAYQRALDREVRIDQISSTRPPLEEILAKLATAVQAAARVRHDRVEPVVASDLEEKRGAFVVLRTKEGATLEKVLDDVLAAGIGVRLAILRSIAEVVLARGDNAILCVPLALDQLKLRTDDVPRVFVAGIELLHRREARHDIIDDAPEGADEVGLRHEDLFGEAVERDVLDVGELLTPERAHEVLVDLIRRAALGEADHEGRHLFVGEPRLEDDPAQALAEQVEGDVVLLGLGAEGDVLTDGDPVGRDLKLDVAELTGGASQRRGDLAAGLVEGLVVDAQERGCVAQPLHRLANGVCCGAFFGGHYSLRLRRLTRFQSGCHFFTFPSRHARTAAAPASSSVSVV